ncbi:PIG-P-domain-containing protein [Sistotremastrum niveocremeum HHB9708]|uniref:PIG-P-domain-containing protein n=2 Tax=Sistotremastraceae TaxID=3402574 RepID=A0A165AB20_9AGAM|nr:PIG-P-domain-containing protein [Sistotremastrum niveocremeum HHB9708]KZT32606.1 PIG-P-domain-containing protein [Sistotremastrum suecicum HHB10207 ss-3]
MAEKGKSRRDSLDATSPLSPLASYPVGAAEEKSRAREMYGFAAWVTTYLAFIVYVIWGVVPPEWLDAVGITWYPSREWTILVPAWTVVTVLLTYFSYFALALYGTPKFSDLATITDTRGTRYEEEMGDIPLSIVNTILFGNTRQS